MVAIIWYILKVIIGSGILTGYYFLSLRNKSFHKWNRFYILISVVFVLAFPLIKINIFQNYGADNSVVQIIKNINSNEDTVVQIKQSDIVTGYIWKGIEAMYILISFLLAGVLIDSIHKIYKWKKVYPKRKLEEIDFHETDLESAPFSFFKSIFWNNAIELDSSTGEQILRHEISHVKELHTMDKIFMNIILVFFWMNPFFYIMKKELNMIHEFIADQAAVPDNNVDLYSRMILKTIYPNQHFTITNNFFYSPIKRRLLMLIKNQHSKKSYIGRLMAIPLLAIIFSAFTLKVKEIVKKQPLKEAEVTGNFKPAPWTLKMKQGEKDSVPKVTYNNKEVTKVAIIKDSKYVTVTFKDGTTKRVLKKDFPPPPPPPALNAPPPPPVVSQAPDMPDDALYMLNNVRSSKVSVMALDPSEIKQINVLKNTQAVSKYGEEGKNGVIEVITDVNLLPKLTLEKEVITGDEGNDKTFTKVEQDGTFPGGQAAWIKYISNILKNNINSMTPKDQGTCRVRFIVEKDGSISNIETLSMQGTKLADIAVEAIKNGPKWNPAVQNGHIVRSYHEQPITFVMKAD